MARKVESLGSHGASDQLLWNWLDRILRCFALLERTRLRNSRRVSLLSRSFDYFTQTPRPTHPAKAGWGSISGLNLSDESFDFGSVQPNQPPDFVAFELFL